MTHARFAVDDLVLFAAKCFGSYGVPDDDARIAAEALVASDMRGVHSHGLLLLARYCRQLALGGTVSAPKLRTVRDSPATALLDGGAGLGQVTATKAMRMAIGKASENGVGLVSVCNSHHFGAAAYYASLAVSHGMIGVATTNAGVTMTTPGGSGRLIGNNPFAFAVPNRESPFVLDLAMSQSSGGRIRRMAETHEAIPIGWVVDQTGQDTTDARDYVAGGALLPIGGHKGFGLALVIEILSAVLSGSSTTTDIRIDQLEPDVPAGIGHLLLAIDIAALRNPIEFHADLEHLFGKLVSPLTAAHVPGIRLPGQAAGEKANRAAQQGVPLPGDVFQVIERLSMELSVPLPPTI